MPGGIKNDVVLSSLEGQQLLTGGILKIYTLLFAIMQFVKCYVYFCLYSNTIKTM